MNHYKETADLYDRVAALYESKFMSTDLYNQTYDNFCDAIHADHPSVLELGCGPGNITRYLLNKRPDSDLDAIDFSPKMIALAQKNNPTAHFTVMDARNIGQLLKKYDGLLCGFIMPYLSSADCEKLISDADRLLNPNGVIYLSFVEGDYAQSGYRFNGDGTEKYHFFFHQKKWLLGVLRKNNFNLISSSEIEYLTDNPTQTHVVIIARKNKKGRS